MNTMVTTPHPELPVPPLDARRSVKVGDTVKVIFEDGNNDPERMWVVVTAVFMDTFTGTLDNEPFALDAELGDVFSFGPEHIIDIIPAGLEHEAHVIRHSGAHRHNAQYCDEHGPEPIYNALARRPHAGINLAIRPKKKHRGQGLAEYALLLALIAIVVIAALLFLGGQVSTILTTVGDSL